MWLRESLEADDESVPARLVQAPEHGGAPWGWITALGLSAGRMPVHLAMERIHRSRGERRRRRPGSRREIY